MKKQFSVLGCQLPVYLFMLVPVSLALKLILIAAGIVLLLVLAVKVIIPLLLMFVGGVGVEAPIPPRIARYHPALSILLFTVGGPILFLFTLGGVLYLAFHLRSG